MNKVDKEELRTLVTTWPGRVSKLPKRLQEYVCNELTNSLTCKANHEVRVYQAPASKDNELFPLLRPENATAVTIAIKILLHYGGGRYCTEANHLNKDTENEKSHMRNLYSL